VLLVVLRILQGLAVGGEWAGAAILAVEHAPPGRRGFFGSFTQLGSPAGMLLATGLFFLVRGSAGDAAFLEWAWRIPFLVSAVLVVVGLVIRLRITDAPEFVALRRRGDLARLPVADVLRAAPREVILTTGLRLSQIALFVLLTTYGLTYIAQEIGRDSSAGLLAVVVSSALGLASTPLWGILSDRIGRRTPYLVGAVGGTVTLLLFFLAVGTGSTLLVVLSMVLAVNVTHDAMYGPQAAWFAELFDKRLRYSGASLGYGIGSVVAGGFAPLVAAAVVGATGSFWLVVVIFAGVSVLTVVAAALARETAFGDLDRPQEDQEERTPWPDAST
jgi:MFS transporter, MHS family, shikimate and dehydroshikimate transport protein